MISIFINKEEVVCDKNITIKEQLSNTSSVILNNCYPKSWEQDKDYVSKFYMPEDYSSCEIHDSNYSKTTTIDVTYKLDTFKGDIGENALETENNVIIVTEDNEDIIVNSGIISGSNVLYYIPVRQKTYTIVGGGTIYYSKEIATGVAAEEVQSPVECEKGYLIFTSKPTRITYETTTDIIFSGIVKNSGNISLNPRYPHYAALQILDYKTFLSEGDTLNYVLTSDTIENMIRKVTNGITGFEVGTIALEKDSTIGNYNCDQKTAYDVFEYLAEVANARWFTTIADEETLLIEFYSPDNLPEAETIEYTTEYFTDHNINDITFSYSSNDYRNKQVITSNKAVAGIPQVETISGTYALTYPISKVISITSNDIEYSVATTNEKELGVSADFYYKAGNNTLTTDNEYSNIVFLVQYYPIVTSRQTAYNLTEIDRINNNTSRDGTIARYEKREDISSTTEMAKVAQTYLDYKGAADITLTIKTDDHNLFNIGEQVYFNAPIEKLKTRYLVTQKTTSLIIVDSVLKIFYTFVLSSSFNDENAINFFDNQRRKMIGNIGEGEYISRYMDLAASTNIIFEGIEIKGVQTVENELETKLDTKV